MVSIGVLEAAADAFCAESPDELTAAEALTVMARLEVVQRRLSASGLGLVPHVTTQGSPVELGGTSFSEVIARRLHISKSAARRRIADAEQLTPRRALSGEPLAPMLPNVAAALGRGDIGDEHVRVVRQFFDKLPTLVDVCTREAAEQQLAQMAAQFSPEQLRVGADRLMALLNPDGEFSDADRSRRRGLTIGQQGFDGMSPINGLLDPETRAYLDAVFRNWPPPACATRSMKVQSWMPNPPRKSPSGIGALGRNATTTPYEQACAPACLPASWARTTDCQSRWLCRQPCKNSNRGPEWPSPVAAPDCPCGM